MATKTNTNQLTQAVLRYLTLNGHFVFRNNNAPVYDPTRQVYRKNSNGLNGVPDIMGCTKLGRALGIEVKSRYDAQSDAQKRFEEKFKKRGAIYILCRSVDDVINAGL
jgi:hypothetical protein